MQMTRLTGILTVGALLWLSGCVAVEVADEPVEEMMLGPHDGRDLPGVDLERVQVGQVAPNFSLDSYGGDVITLSDYRGEKNVVLVFYRGYW
jgi:AhpC/TSA family